MQDTIVRELTVKAPQEKVYQTITDPQKITSWFPDKVEGTFEVGQYSDFFFTEHNHKAQVYVVDKKPFTYFAYRWVPGVIQVKEDVLDIPNTLVEFFIDEMGTETKVTVKESGFSLLPAEMAEESFKQNSGGWGYMIGRLEKLLNQS